MRRRLAVVIVAIAAALTGCGGGSDDFIEVPGIGSTRIDVVRPTPLRSALVMNVHGREPSLQVAAVWGPVHEPFVPEPRLTGGAPLRSGGRVADRT